MLSIPPISSYMCIDKIRKIYETFPFINKYTPICVPIQDSTGKYRMVYTRRPLVIGYKYIFRLKQLAEEKFSAVSLASTNIKNENTKSKMAKTHNARYASTPVRVYGEMESSTISAHVGADIFIEEFNLNSSSPEARRLNRELLDGDPFKFNIVLDENCVSQSADIVQAYLKTLGERLCFHKLKKYKIKPATKIIVERHPIMHKNIVFRVPEEIRGNQEQVQQFIQECEQKEKQKIEKGLIRIVSRIPGIKERNQELESYKQKLNDIGINPKYVLKS